MTLASAILLAAFGVAALALARARLALGSMRTRLFAPSAGSASAGIRYAFTTAFLPRAKESASGHFLSYAAGLLYHAGIFTMLACLLLSLTPLRPPAAVTAALAALFAVALAAGLGLLVKRLLDVALRALSVPDDFVSNLLVDAALASALAATEEPSALFVFQLVGAGLLLYAPLGKLGHMLFLFTARRQWGAWYGRRGVLP